VENTPVPDPLYYADPAMTTFAATVVACEARDGRPHVVLDRTAFYPTSGGQPFDTGRLGSVRVLDVLEQEDGTIAHVTSAPIAPGTVVRGDIDWARRFDHMQQHTGQHMLSAAFDQLQHVRTVSFHLGAESSTIDLAREVTAAEIAAAEGECNRVVFEDRPISIRFVSEEEAKALPLRKESLRPGRLRLIEIANFDLSACGGTHVARTGQVGAVAVAGWERFKGGSRVSFVCGGRALRSHGALRDIVAGATRTLSVAAADIAPTLERLQTEVREAARTVKRLEDELAGYQAVSFRAGAETIGACRGVLKVIAGRDAAALKTIGQAIVSEPGFVVVLVGDGQPAPVVIVRSADVTIDAGAWMKGATAALGGRGGGRPEAAQGGVAAAPEAVVEYARKTLADASR